MKCLNVGKLKIRIFSYTLDLTFVLDAQKNRLIQTILLSTHNICFAGEIRKLIFTMHSYLEAWTLIIPFCMTVSTLFALSCLSECFR